MSDRIIQTADLSIIEHNLKALHEAIGVVDSNIHAVDNHVDSVESALADLAERFDEYVTHQMLANRAQTAETRLVNIRQELDKKYGHYDVVRRTATGILQATDLSIIRQETITTASENIMLQTPGYWLAPCLVALSAWICDQRELAERALKEAITRDIEKTSLFFTLICRRSDRKAACLKWVERYLMEQDPTTLSRHAIIVLAAFANGLWGNDTENRIYGIIQGWLANLTQQPGWQERQAQLWQEAIKLKTPDVTSSISYTYLPQYSPTWPGLLESLNEASLHKALLKYFTSIFEQPDMEGTLKQQLDEILNTLVTNFDKEELPLREKEKFEQLVIESGGDEKKAKEKMKTVQAAFMEHKDFLQLLTDTALAPETTSADPATRKFAIALSSEWIKSAYMDVVASNRSKIPPAILLKIEDFEATTNVGDNEAEVIVQYDAHIDQKQAAALAGKELSSFDKACRYLRYALLVIGLISTFTGALVIGIPLLIAAYVVHSRYSKKKAAYNAAIMQCNELEKRRPQGKEIIRALMAETVDYRRDLASRDSAYEKTLDFLKTLSPDQFMKMGPQKVRRVTI